MPWPQRPHGGEHLSALSHNRNVNGIRHPIRMNRAAPHECHRQRRRPGSEKTYEFLSP